MTISLRKPMTLTEFLAWEEQQEFKWEFDGEQPVAMTAVTLAHAAIQGNLTVALITRLRGGSCRFYGPELKIQADRSIRYPDGLVSCTPGALSDKVAHDPVVVFEILSDSTARTDRIVKNREYRATPSIRRYVLLEQTYIGATVFERQGNDWVGRTLGEGDLLALPEIGIEVPLAEFYIGLGYEAEPG
jgi:Uma2 family endonuclease